jgi:hypothetical protein
MRASGTSRTAQRVPKPRLYLPDICLDLVVEAHVAFRTEHAIFGGMNVLRSLLRRPPQPGRLLPLNRQALQRCLYFERRLQSVSSVPGAIIECGVGQGFGLALWASLTKGRLVWAFDSFEGFPAFAPEDKASEATQAAYRKQYRQFTVPYVHSLLIEFGLSRADIDQRIAFAKGFIPESLSLYDGKPIALLHLDLDIYEPYKAALAYFWDLVSPGGVVLFDEYNKAMDVAKFPGAQIAVNEFLAARGLRHLLQRDPAYGNSFIQKP